MAEVDALAAANVLEEAVWDDESARDVSVVPARRHLHSTAAHHAQDATLPTVK